jgi:[protein-PII] uridylyltransferase
VIRLADHPGLLSRMALALALAGASSSTRAPTPPSDGFATAVFWVQDAEGGAYEESRLPRLKRDDRQDAQGRGHRRARRWPSAARDAEARAALRRADAHLTFDNEASDLYTVIEVDTRDRFGLLYDLTSARWRRANVNIFSAVIATYGEQAVDVFYVKDLFGLKIRHKAKQEAIIRKLRAAVERAAPIRTGA